MSAFIAAKNADRVELLTDGACYNAEHVLTKIVSKVWSSRILPIAITGRGNLQLVEHMAREIIAEADAAGSVDHTVEGYLPEYIEDIRAAGVKDCDLGIAAWSETAGPALYVLDTDGQFTTRPYELRSKDDIWCAVELTSREIYDLGGATRFLEAQYLQEKGADLMDLIRSKPTQGYYSVGGHCQLTTVTAGGVETVTMRTWPEDKVGEKINPGPKIDITPLRPMMNRAAMKKTRRSA